MNVGNQERIQAAVKVRDGNHLPLSRELGTGRYIVAHSFRDHSLLPLWMQQKSSEPCIGVGEFRQF